MLRPGIYEQVIDRRLAQALDQLPENRKATTALDQAEASSILSRYVADVVRKALERMHDVKSELSDQVALVNQLVAMVGEMAQEDLESISVDERAQQLLALLGEQDPRLALGKSARDVVRPETSLAQSSLFTGAVHEPQMFSELKKEIASADRIDMLVSFIKWSGLRLIMEELTEFTRRGGQLRIITTSYMGATDIKAIQELATLEKVQIKVSYDTKRTRLHAKTYVFYRDTGFTTAYVGSSNLSNAAISSGLEWNVKVTAQDQPQTIRKIAATFDAYWHSDEFEYYSNAQRNRLYQALKAERYTGERPQFLFDIRPYPYQQEILDKLQAEREVRGHWRNLVVAATGTGKTVIAALDYRRFCKQNPGKANRLLFIAHREEILRQSQATFACILKDVNFGELYVGGIQPGTLDHLFVSVQTLHSQALYDRLPADYYDYIVIDESHHAAAVSYGKALEHFRPKVLLGLTATPERMDGKSILDYFEGRIAAEIRLPEAIDRKLLCPFQYFGVSDTVDLSELHWVRGGYDRSELSNVYTMNRAVAQKRADHILQSLDRYVADLNDVKALGFCVSVEHARFMAEHFNQCGFPSMYLVGTSSDEDRRSARQRLVSGKIRILFVVDIYNEGVDIPEVNTVLFLRPTESLTIFLQQLGRGLRLFDGKDCLTVLDFIGAANRKYNFEEKFAALLSGSHHNVEYELQHGFVNVPKGCYIQLEKKAAQIILGNIRQSYGFRAKLVSLIQSFEEDSGQPLTLGSFLRYHHMDARWLYAKFSFSRLCVEAGVREPFCETIEETMTRAFSRLVAIDSRRWIQFLLDLLPRLDDVDFTTLSHLEQQVLNMFYTTVWQETIEDFSADRVWENLYALSDSPVMLEELMELLRFRLDEIDFIDIPAGLPYDCPLDVHCSYSRDQLLVALDFQQPRTLREGVKYLKDKKTDVLLITLNKSDKDYSPTTLYNDYAISPILFHWQSQSTTSADSTTGQRYIHHKKHGGKVLLFVREFKQDACGAAPYTFLGTADYVSHKDSRPMNIVWRLHHEIPAKYLKKTMQVMG
ncbi:MAG: DUF3427 domain-containing protein [Clostridiales bacterium]|nr:DUF3427 domain-containing protein [Clostridiales bacterium]